MSDREELAPLVEELAETLEQLRAELDAERPRRVRELLQFTERYTIPAVIAVLEANIRLLKLTAGSIRLAQGRLDDGERGGASAGRGAAAETLERALDDLGGALRGEPTDPEARRLLTEARELRREVRGRLEEPDAEADAESDADWSDDADRVPVRSEEQEIEDEEDGESPQVDVDAELASIKRELGSEPGEDDPGAGEN